MQIKLLVQLLLIVLLAGCVTVEAPESKEPAIIAIRNLSGEDLSQVQLSGMTAQDEATGRFGSVSPVPRGVTQSVVRARHAPPLPPEMRLHWSDKFGKVYRDQVSIKAIIERASGDPNEALVFIIQPDMRIGVTLEYTRP